MQNEIDTFLDFVYQSKSPKTYAMYKIALQSFVETVGEDAQLTKETYVKYLRKKTLMTPSTQALYRSAIKGLYLSAADSQPIDTSFFEQTNKRLGLKPGKRLILFNHEGIEKILAYINTTRNSITDLRDRAFILLLADSGLRVSEACNLRIGDVDLFERRAVVVGKGNKQALVKFSSRVAQALQDYLQARQYTTKNQPLFLRHSKKAAENVQPVNAGDMWHVVKQRATEAGVNKDTIRVHDFRHYFVTAVYHAKGIKTAQILARHEKVETTSHYSHLVEDEGQAYDDIFNK